ncbi:hypothetical protein Ddc_11206 [Ditylenchus destructor]|nr:hypothetical protein Ddc_11206 [Ditylenchus destructor]
MTTRETHFSFREYLSSPVTRHQLLLCTLAAGIIISLFPSPSDSLVIYRRKPKPKLICHEETMSLVDEMITPSGADFDVPVPSPKGHHHKKNSGDKSSEEHRQRRSVTISYHVTNSSKFNLDVDPEQNEPVINLTSETEEQFEIVGEDLTEEEKKSIRDKLVNTCRALNLN